MEAKERLIVALDISPRAASALVDLLGDLVSWFKVGPALLIRAGGVVVLNHLLRKGKRIFLDLKFHETPDSMAAACLEATRAAGASMLSIHCLNGREALRKCKEAIAGEGPWATWASREGKPPLLLGVTVLTSHGFETLERLRLLRGYSEICRGMMTDGLRGERREQVTDLAIRLAEEAAEAGLDGVIASPLEAPVIRRAFGPDFTIVTPGIRFAGEAADNHVRTATPRGAILAGADYVIVGRAITRARDARAAAGRAIAEIAAAMEEVKRNECGRS